MGMSDCLILEFLYNMLLGPSVLFLRLAGQRYPMHTSSILNTRLSCFFGPGTVSRYMGTRKLSNESCFLESSSNRKRKEVKGGAKSRGPLGV